ncbi:MAG TPA: protein-L-isoaspartate(D-aspartate) O-methyltransferase [Candidatus Marinimicrobia bacterium]|nr:protein-L-isoaspartate(D-aspartate) O-methyltransferase [Candidatus Neomarinimicrobiota bacterium]
MLLACVNAEGQSVEDDTLFYQLLRQAMIENQIIDRGVSDERVIKAMNDVPRHLFVKESLRDLAYADGPLPIGHNQTISQPYIVAYMTEILQPDTHHIVLEVGTGSGYQAAILSKLVNHVYSIEIIPELGKEAANRLDKLGYDNVTVKIGDGYNGWEEHSPFDRIIVTAAPEQIPKKLVDQLKSGGLMVLPVGKTSFGQDMRVVKKDKTGQVTTQETIPVRFVPMIHEHNE